MDKCRSPASQLRPQRRRRAQLGDERAGASRDLGRADDDQPHTSRVGTLEFSHFLVFAMEPASAGVDLSTSYGQMSVTRELALRSRAS